MEIIMYIVTRLISAFARPVMGTFETTGEALAFLETLGVLFVEEDEKHPGCYDGLGKDGSIYSIEPRR
jgi:hypothetical protein